jgi:hypothetical protein
MVKLARPARMRVPAAGAVLLLAAGTIAGCGGSGPPGSGGAGSTGSGGSGSPGSGPSTTASTSTHPAPPRPGSLTLNPADPTTRSEITFTFTARAASGVHGTHEISYSLSVLGPDLTGCVGTHETGSPSVARGAQGQIVLGPSELRAPWCAGRYSARVLELSSAHCTGSAPCPQYVRVVGLVGRATFTVRGG